MGRQQYDRSLRNQAGGRGRSGRGQPHGRNNNNRRYFGSTNNKTSNSTSNDYKFTPQSNGKVNNASYATVKETIVQYVQKNYKGGHDIAKSLKDLKVIDLQSEEPTRTMSTETDAAAKASEQNGFDIKYQEELRMYLDRKKTLNEGLNKAYALIFTNYCTRPMQARIEEHPDFASKIDDNPIALLEAIKTLMHAPVRAQYPLVAMTDALAGLLNIRQKEDEPLLEYVKRFKQQRDIVKSQLGTDLLDKFTETLESYKDATTATDKAEIKAQAFEKWLAYLLIRGSDPSKYGSLLRGFVSQYSLGNDQYPTTLETATDVLANHRFDQRYLDNKKQRKKRNEDRHTPKDGDNDHNPTSFAQQQARDVTCYCCGKKGHTSNKCSKRETIPKSEWHVNRAMSHMQNDMEDDDDNHSAAPPSETEEEDSDNDSVTSTTSTSSRNRRSGSTSSRKTNRNRKPKWNSFQSHDLSLHETSPLEVDFLQQLKDVYLLDTGSTIPATIMNPDLITNIKRSEKPTTMKTNAGAKTMNLEGEIPDYGRAHFDPTQLANIFGFFRMADKYHIQYDNKKEDAFLVHSSCGTVKFKRTPEGLYTFKPSQAYLDDIAESKKQSKKNELTHLQADNKATPNCNMVTTVTENRKGYTDRQFENAKRARSLYHIVGCPTVENFKHILRQNIIKNCPVTVEDVNIAEKIFGPDIGALKGKSTRRRPTPVRDDYIEIPPELIEKNQNLIYALDLMYVNNMPMMTGIDRSIRFRTLVPLKNREAKELYRGIDNVFRCYNKAGFRIGSIHCDGEFKPLMDSVKDELGIDMNYTARGEHVPEAERNNRTIAERIRAAYHNLPYKAIPKLMLKYLAMECTHQLNLFPAKGGVSPYYSPHMIITGTNWDYNKHCQVPLGAYVQANQDNDPTNTNAPRTIDAIYLRPMKNKQGGHELMNLQTGKHCTRQRVKALPVTDLVIKAVEQMAADQGIKTLKITGRNKTPLYPADWIAGVDYEDDQNNNDDWEIDEDYEDDLEENDGPEDDIENEDNYEPIDQEEIDEILADPEPKQHAELQDANPIADQNDNNNDNNERNEDTNAVSDDDTSSNAPILRRSARSNKGVPDDKWTYSHHQQVKKAVRFEQDVNDLKYNLMAQVHPNPEDDWEYEPQDAMVIARLIQDINTKVDADEKCFGQQYILQKGLKKFGEKGTQAAKKEMGQLHDRTCFGPLDISELTPDEKRKAQEALMFLTEKRDKSIKGRCVYNGKPTREWLSREDAASPTASLESIMLTAIIDAKEKRDVMTADIPNAFIQAKMPEPKKGDERVVMKITGVLVDLMVELAPEVYGPYVVMEKGQKVLYVQVLRALYGMLIAALLWYKRFKSDLEKEHFKFNPYDPCVANKMVNHKQHTIRFHVDDLMCSHVDTQVNNKFLKWLNHMYGKHGEVKATRGKVHDYLGMTFDFSEEGKVKIDMIDYMCSMVDDFSIPFGPHDIASTPAPEDLFAEGNSPLLDEARAKEFHTTVAKGLFACKRARPDIQPTIAVLCTRVKAPNEDDWRKLIRLLKYINGSRNDKLILSADDLHVIKWYIDSSFAVHPDYKSHTGGIMTFGGGAPICKSQKQKLNTRSSTEAELVGADDMSVMILWTKLFMDAQGYCIRKNILKQDNQSTILLVNNGKKSSSKRTRALNIRYFFLTDQVEKGNLMVEYCPTKEMIGDFMSKPLQGALFQKFRRLIMGHSVSSSDDDDRSVLEGLHKNSRISLKNGPFLLPKKPVEGQTKPVKNTARKRA